MAHCTRMKRRGAVNPALTLLAHQLRRGYLEQPTQYDAGAV